MKSGAFTLVAWGVIACFPGMAQQKPATPQLDVLNKEYEQKIASDLQQPRDSAVAELNKKYVSALIRSEKLAQQDGKLEESLAIRAEISRIEANQKLPDGDDDIKSFERLGQLRQTYRSSVAKLDDERDGKLLALNTAFARHLDALVISLTKEGKLDEAQVVSERRKSLAIAEPKDEPKSPPDNPRRKLRFQATIPATDVIKIADRKLWIEDHAIKFFAENVKINGTPWKPRWTKKRKSDAFDLSKMDPFTDAKVKVEMISGRGELKVLTLPAPDNGQTLSFQISDPQPDAGDYDILISW